MGPLPTECHILLDAKSMHNILKVCMYIENMIREYLNYLFSLYQYIWKRFEIYINAMTVYCGLFHLLNIILNLLNIHVYMVNILQGYHNYCQ